MIILSIIVIGLQTSTFAHAKQGGTIESCEKKQNNNIEYSQCLDSVKESIDRELQTWVNNQTFLLEEFTIRTGRSSALIMFKRSQKNFITFRENNCRWQYLAEAPSVTAASTYKKCYIFTSKNRINELNLISK
ncbi:MAG: DUF1311 domain-containing protein [Alteromonadaceae bacterium]|nr:DUF1311 domain-containing protein [Alteromonadaceae bacterium]